MILKLHLHGSSSQCFVGDARRGAQPHGVHSELQQASKHLVDGDVGIGNRQEGRPFLGHRFQEAAGREGLSTTWGSLDKADSLIQQTRNGLPLGIVQVLQLPPIHFEFLLLSVELLDVAGLDQDPPHMPRQELVLARKLLHGSLRPLVHDLVHAAVEAVGDVLPGVRGHDNLDRLWGDVHHLCAQLPVLIQDVALADDDLVPSLVLVQGQPPASGGLELHARLAEKGAIGLHLEVNEGQPLINEPVQRPLLEARPHLALLFSPLQIHQRRLVGSPTINGLLLQFHARVDVMEGSLTPHEVAAQIPGRLPAEVCPVSPDREASEIVFPADAVALRNVLCGHLPGVLSRKGVHVGPLDESIVVRLRELPLLQPSIMLLELGLRPRAREIREVKAQSSGSSFLQRLAGAQAILISRFPFTHRPSLRLRAALLGLAADGAAGSGLRLGPASCLRLGPRLCFGLRRLGLALALALRSLSIRPRCLDDNAGSPYSATIVATSVSAASRASGRRGSRSGT
mmetsp:Transcript_59698/g.194840  ORF Transcript_59698/g.194840 Transcript_59698/m.194840 type:complete len:513 (-) Transcript_59698:241-1779(-)